MTTLREARRKAYELDQDLGRVEALTGAAAQTATAVTLGGGISAQKWVNHWLLRSEAADAANRAQRWGKNFNGDSGQFTHTGTAYSDTTHASEFLEVSKYEPRLLESSIQTILAKTLRRDREIVPARKNAEKHWLHELTWLSDVSDIHKVTWSHSPVISRNREFEKWLPDTAGGWSPEFWTLAGSGATIARSTSNLRKAPYVALFTRVGADCTLTQSVGILPTGRELASSDGSLRGKTVTAVLVVRAEVADRVRVRIFEDGSATASSSYHTGSSKWEELTCEVVVGSATDTSSIVVSLENDNTAVSIADCYLLEGVGVNETVRSNNYELSEEETDPRYDQNHLALLNPAMGTGQWVIYSHRPYPTFDPTRVRNGTADLDETDCPADLLATGAIAELYFAVKEYGLAELWRQRWEPLQLQHQYKRSNRGLGANILPTMSAPAVRR